MRLVARVIWSVIVFLLLASMAGAQTLDKKVLSLEAAKKIAAAAEVAAREKGVGVVIAVVDDGGHLILLHRLDDTQVASVNVGIGKARNRGDLSAAEQGLRGPDPSGPRGRERLQVAGRGVHCAAISWSRSRIVAAEKRKGPMTSSPFRLARRPARLGSAAVPK